MADDWFTQSTVPLNQQGRTAPRPVQIGGADPTRPSQITKAQADATAASGTAPYAAPTAAAGLTGQVLTNAEKQAKLDDAARERAEAADAAKQKRINQEFQSGLVLKNIKEARDLIADGGVTGWSAALSKLPETRARRLRAVLDTITSNLTFDKLQEIRDQSVTGGAVGNVSDRDIALLGASIGNVNDQYQKDTDLLNVLNDAESKYLGLLADIEGEDRAQFISNYRSERIGDDVQSDLGGGQPWTREQSIAQWGDELYGPDGNPLGPEGGPSFDAQGNSRGFAASVEGAMQPDPAQPGGTQAGTPGAYEGSYLSQGMSGVNEGVAGTLGFPVDAVSSLLNLAPQGINAIANTDIPTIESPVLGGQWWNDVLSGAGSIAPETDSTGKQFVRRVGQSVGAAAIPIAGTATTAGRAIAGGLSALGGGMGAATAQQVYPDNPLVEMGAETIASLLAGGAGMKAAQGQARKAAEAAVPSIADLKNQASNLYSQAEIRGVVAGPSVTSKLASDLDAIATKAEVKGSPKYTEANEALRVIERYRGADLNPTQIQVIREGLADSVQATEGRQRKIARDMLTAFDDATTPLAPELKEARSVASKYLSAGEIQKAIDLAEPGAAQFSQSGMSNALRTQFRGLDRDMIRGNRQFNPDVAAAIIDVSRGTPGTNALTRVGKMAPTGIVSGGLSAGVPFAIGNAMGGPAVGAAASTATMGIGTAAKLLGNRAVQNDARVAELLARNGGALQIPGIVDNGLKAEIAAILAGQGSQYLNNQ